MHKMCIKNWHAQTTEFYKNVFLCIRQSIMYGRKKSFQSITRRSCIISQKKRLGYRILTFNIKQNSIIFFPLKDLSLCCHISIKMMIDVSSNEKTRSSSGQSISRFRWCIIEKTVAEKCHFFNTSNLFWQKSLITSTSLCLI